MPRVLNKRALRRLLKELEVYIGRGGRGLKGSKWGNRFVIGKDGTRAEVIAKYEAWIHNQPELMAQLGELRGKDLVCWCAPAACHGDVLLLLANECFDAQQLAI